MMINLVIIPSLIYNIELLLILFRSRRPCKSSPVMESTWLPSLSVDNDYDRADICIRSRGDGNHLGAHADVHEILIPKGICRG